MRIPRKKKKQLKKRFGVFYYIIPTAATLCGELQKIKMKMDVDFGGERITLLTPNEV